METPDAELVHQAVAGQRAAYGLLARRWFRRILALCHSKLASVADAEDATQETLLRGYLELAQLKQGDYFGAWLRTIATHVCCDRLRTPRRRREIPSGSAAEFDGRPAPPGETPEGTEERRRILQMVSELPEELREVLLLHYFDNMTYDELAGWLGVARATISERLARAREILKRRLLPERRPSP